MMKSLQYLKQHLAELSMQRNILDHQLRVDCLTQAGKENSNASALLKTMRYMQLYGEQFVPFVNQNLLFAGTPGYCNLPQNIAGLTGDIGHFCANYQRLIEIGIEGIRETVQQSCPKTDCEEQLKQAYLHTVDLFIAYMQRHAEEAERMAETCPEQDAKENLMRIAADVRYICAHKPATFMQGMQLLLFAHSYVLLKPYTDTITFGNLDRVLESLYNSELKAGTLTFAEAHTIICHFYLSLIPMNRDTQNIVLGGSDANGNYFENDLTVLFLEAQNTLHLEQPSVSLKIRQDTSQRVWDAALTLLAKGGGMPSFLNDELYIASLLKRGFNKEEANTFCNVGCYEATPYGNTFGGTVSGQIKLVSEFNQFFTKNVDYDTFDDLLAGWETYFSHRYITQIAPRFAAQRHNIELNSACPFLGLIMDGCVESLRLPEQYGAKNNIFSVLLGGIGSFIDSLLCIKHFVYDTNTFTLSQLRKEVAENYPDKEVLATLRTYPMRFGSNDSYSNSLAVREANLFSDIIVQNPIAPHVIMMPGLFIFTDDIYSASLPATPDGRVAGERYSYGAAASELLPRRDTTKVLSSTAALPLVNFPIGAPMTINLTADVLKTQKGRESVRTMVEAFHLNGGTHIQINIADPDVLRDAQKHPEQYKDLLIRISGHTEPFVRLNDVLQNALIARAEMGC